MTPIWFLAGLCFAIAAVVVVLPWLRTVPGLSQLPVLPWYAGALALPVMLALGGLFLSSSSAPRNQTSASTATRPAAGNTADTWADIANNMAGAGPPVKSADRNNAQPMNAAVVSLQKRLAGGGGSAEDWELLAKSYEFLGRPAEAGKARAHQLPPLPEADSGVPR